MSSRSNRRIVLAERPVNRTAVEADFRIEQVPVPEPADGQVLVRTIFLSLDPYMRTRISAAKSYTPPLEVGAILVGEVVGKVIESRHPSVRTGDYVLARSGWQEYAVHDAEAVTRVDADAAPLSWYLGVLGMPGMTAYFGLLDVGCPQAGETVIIPAAAGAVGQVAGQIAKLKGCRVIGVSGSPEKVAYVTGELGFDACVDRRGKDAEALAAEIDRLCPEGVDIFFDTVGGELHDAVMPHIALRGRIVIVGAVARASHLEEPDVGPRWNRQLLAKRARTEGFLVWDCANRAGEFHCVMSDWLRQDLIRYREQVAVGLEAAPAAFISMLSGANLGKQLVKVAVDD